jgi:hypothetical protein
VLILSGCGGHPTAAEHVGKGQRREARCGHVTGNVVENLQIGFDFTFFDNMLQHRPNLQRLGSGTGQLRQPQKMMIGIEPAAKNGGVDMFEQAWVAAE